MAIAEVNYADITADGDTSWVASPAGGCVVAVDSVDSDGNSAAWGSATASLLYSPDGSMRTAVSENGTDITGKSDGFSRVFRGIKGFFAIAGSGISSETLRIKTVPLSD